MVPRENKNNAYAKFGGTNKEYYGIFRNGLLRMEAWKVQDFNGVWTRDLAILVQRYSQLCYEATDVSYLNYSIQGFWSSSPDPVQLY